MIHDTNINTSGAQYVEHVDNDSTNLSRVKALSQHRSRETGIHLRHEYGSPRVDLGSINIRGIHTILSREISKYMAFLTYSRESC